MRIGLGNPDTFSSIASHMGAISGAPSIMAGMTDEELRWFDIYIDHGLQDDRVPVAASQTVHDYLVGRGIEHKFELRDGGHTSGFYMAGMPKSMKMHSEHFIKNGVNN